LNLLDQQVIFRASDEDYYLQNLPAHGPSDIQQLFQVFCEEDSNIIDVGANIGVTAVIAGLLARRGSVLALEPVKGTFDYLEANIAASTLTNVKCRNVAAASAPGHIQVVTRPGHSFASFVGYDEVLERYAGYDEERVEAITLDQLVEREEVGRAHFVKIDVEGFELEVLRGCTQLLEQSQPTVLLEANHYCLNIFRRVSMVDFTEEILSYFPIVYAVDASSEILDLKLKTNHPVFFHDNVVRGRYQNLLCGFDPSIKDRLESLSAEEQAPEAHLPLHVVDTGLAEKVRRHVGNLLSRKRVNEET
jgi:FkbM family methyltransferase